MIPIHDENPTLRTPVVTIALLVCIVGVWIVVQGAGIDPQLLAATTCNWGLVPGEITRLATVGEGVAIGHGLACIVDDDPRNALTPLTSMFLHGGWGHLLGNALFLWVFGNNVEDSMGRVRFLVFYVLCGLVASAAQILVDPSSIVPMVGASGAISGVLGGYIVLYPRVRVHLLVFLLILVTVVTVPAWLMLGYWFVLQVLSGYVDDGSGGGVAFWAHVGGFVAGVATIRLFARRDLIEQHRRGRRVVRASSMRRRHFSS